MSHLETRTAAPQDDGVVHCKVCEKPFRTLQDCLAHELLKHTIKPQKKLRKSLDAIAKLFASEQIQLERRMLRDALAQSQPGQQLHAVLCHYGGDVKELAVCYSEVRELLQKQLKGKIKVYPFGSLVTGLALKDSDIDLFLEHTEPSSMPTRQLFNKIHSCLRRNNCFQDVIAIRHARVPIIRCKHVMTGLSLDINMSSPNSTYNSRFVAELLMRDVRLRELFLFLKLFAKKLKIIGSGSMTSYCLITLIIFGMQQRKQLPSIKQLQARCQTLEVMGVNYGYTLQHVRPLPASLTTLNLIANFFELYSRMDFEKKLLSPYLGYALDLETAFAAPDNFPEYTEQLRAMSAATGEQPEPFQSQRCVCVQDPFEMQHNVGQSITPTNLCYLRQCFTFAHEACTDEKLLAAPDKLYDYLLFGVPEKLLQRQRADSVQPAKLRKQMLIKKDQPVAANAPVVGTVKQAVVATAKPAVAANAKSAVAATAKTEVAATAKTAVAAPAKPAVASTAKPAVAPVAEFAAQVATSTKERLSSCSSVDNAPPLLHVHTLTPTNNDLKCLRADLLSRDPTAQQTIFYYWVECYVDAIKDIMTNIYALKMKLIEPLQPLKDDELPQQFTWMISTALDTWSSRNFQRGTKQSFFAHQLQQTIEFTKVRPQNANFIVNLKGRFSLVIGADYKELRLELKPMADDIFGLQRHSPLTKFFKSLKNMLCNYNFKEKVVSLQYHR